MSILDKVAAAVTPMASDQTRREAHAKARQLAQPGDWLSQLLDHHEQIEGAFNALRATTDPQSRLAAKTELAQLLTAHSLAEEAVLYPALAHVDEKSHAVMAYTEQSAAKLNLGLLDYLPLMSQDFLDKLEHIRGAVLQHVYQEESNWFVELKRKADDQQRLSDRYTAEFERYLDGGGAAVVPPRNDGARPRVS
jgi:hemerythrin superfamily protein